MPHLSLSVHIRDIPATAVEPDEEHPQTLRVRHDGLRLAVIAFGWDFADQNPVALVVFSPENGAVLFVDGFGRTRRISDELCDLPQCLPDEWRAPVVADGSLCSFDDPWMIGIRDGVVCVCQPDILRIGFVFVVFEDLVDGLVLSVRMMYFV